MGEECCGGNKEQGTCSSSAEKKFTKDMTIGHAMRLHPRAAEVFMGFHLGGCSHCSIAEDEVIEQVATGYGIPIDMLLNALNSLFEYDRKRAEAAKAAQASAAAPAAAPKA
jgi:hybrid cluster-associated redox disulfide protein